jgi:hypothetical protein
MSAISLGANIVSNINSNQRNNNNNNNDNNDNLNNFNFATNNNAGNNQVFFILNFFLFYSLGTYNCPGDFEIIANNLKIALLHRLTSRRTDFFRAVVPELLK